MRERLERDSTIGADVQVAAEHAFGQIRSLQRGGGRRDLLIDEPLVEEVARRNDTVAHCSPAAERCFPVAGSEVDIRLDAITRPEFPRDGHSPVEIANFDEGLTDPLEQRALLDEGTLQVRAGALALQPGARV